MGLGRELGFLRERNLRAAGVVGGGERLDEALRGSCDQGELDVVPVGAGGVVDDRPALEGGGLLSSV